MTKADSTPPDAGGQNGAGQEEDYDVLDESHRPALEKLLKDLTALEDDLLDGFDSRRAVLKWLQRTCVRTLGQVDDDWYRFIAAAFRGPGADADRKERTMLSILLSESARTRELNAAAVNRGREQLSAVFIRPSLHRAVRHLRADAGEYVDAESSSTSAHDPNRQRYIAMRPALNELDGKQRTALLDLLDGFDDELAILRWTGDVELACHGEINSEWQTRVTSESSTQKMLTSTADADARGRELFAAHYVLPAFNAGVRDLYGRSIEAADAEAEDNTVPSI